MTDGSNAFEHDAPQPELFSALLTPHRSLNRTGFLVLMGFLCFISFVAGMAFLMMGAWPVIGFFGLDVLAIWWAFRINNRTAKAFEEIRVTPSELRVRRTSHRGHGAERVDIIGVLQPIPVVIGFLGKRQRQLIGHNRCVAGCQDQPQRRERPRAAEAIA